ncbi:allatostatin-A receptor [Fopius arisanus]|uniref:Allatostatin-A receptor n=1 Tax=Fopius arisanus TaxID=64838 RepID=A0A0C9R079_9HYME|nr:PREDICTED: allatostatin-A receptor [Fopius arisanus]
MPVNLDASEMSIESSTLGVDSSVRMFQDAEMESSHGNMTYDNNETLRLYPNVSINEEYIFDRIDIRVIFITLYSIVFFFCFFGNLLVILVVMYSRRMQGITNFFLANLALADLCVGIFCVYQTLINYLMNCWRLGDFLCKTYMFVPALSYTASIMILVLVCVERYLAIIHPIKCRSMLTRGRLRAIVAVVWILAAIYASPRFIYVETYHHELKSGSLDIICMANMKKHNRNVLDFVNLILLYLIPLFLMCCLYTRIAIGLWKSSTAFSGPGLVARTRNGRVQHVHASSKNVLKARRGVIRMLIAVVVMFAVCNFPQQARLLWRHWDSGYESNSHFSTILTVSTFLLSYLNSCLNPLLYAFLSRNFRKAMRELFACHSRGAGRGLNMGYRRGDVARFENGHTANMPHSSVIRLSSTHESPTTQTFTRQSTFVKSS